MAKTWDILRLFVELQVEAELDRTFPTLLGSYWRAAELVDGEDVGRSTAICIATSRGRARPYSSHTAG